ncbi:copper amine oxidase N-terminal domain-containing protein [Paenibacillus shenyangensis]|uniref:copper amine oxidase N-terminal domain-containing protein n=1 Tax=Paenibacillus sp. A9 TaxID=1284352 RepID=UPI000369DC40|nr:copper amine oxidase N-terminal domain-containing protein [Paenibacillus sp. A9]
MKKLLALLGVTTTLLCGSATSAMAASDYVQRPIPINVNGQFVQTDANPEKINNRILVPIRALSSLGLEYNWNGGTKTVSITNADKNQVKVTLNSKTSWSNEKKLTLDVPAQMRHGRVYVPIRFVSEAFGSHVQLEPIRQILFVTSGNNINTKVDEAGKDLKTERQAAISLPIQADFKLINSPQKSYIGEAYTFPAGQADQYTYTDQRTATVVKIKDGKAIAVGQYSYGALADFSAVAGEIKTNTDSALRPFIADPVSFQIEPSNEINAFYIDEKGNNTQLKNGISKIYTDLIVTLPNNK